MKSNDLILRCYIKQEENSWVAVCLDLNLAAQGDNQRDAKQKLEAMIITYVHEAMTVDREYADQLLSRKAPWTEWVKYYAFYLLSVLRKNHPHTFNEIMPMRPA